MIRRRVDMAGSPAWMVSECESASTLALLSLFEIRSCFPNDSSGTGFAGIAVATEIVLESEKLWSFQCTEEGGEPLGNGRLLPSRVH